MNSASKPRSNSIVTVISSSSPSTVLRLLQLDSADVWKLEIEARIALDDFQTAIALAQSAALKEDRLHLLAVVAKGRRKRGMMPEPELVDNIRLLYDQIDTSSLGKRAYEIASDLV